MSEKPVEYTLNGRALRVGKCVCGSVDLRFDAGMMGGVISCNKCGAQIVHNTLEEAIKRWNKSGTGDWTGTDDHKPESSDNDLLSNPRAHDHLGEYRCRDCNGMGGFEGVPGTVCPTCGRSNAGDCAAHTQHETEYKTVDPLYATLHFYYNDPDSMARFRRMQKVDGLYTAVQEFDNWLRNRIKYNPDAPDDPLYIPDDGIDYLIIAREQLAMRLADYDINIWED